ncbi:MAG: HAMP domain-containing histidine kinase [Deltaproteobacteria bacterium]|nr:HAMP domain-containing histidine kinase [Deltaproteobacteria bacterium]
MSAANDLSTTTAWSPTKAPALIGALHELAMQTDVAGVIDVVRRRARALLGADGVTFVLREGDRVYYAEEDAIAPLWKGRRFPASACISGWAMLRDELVTIPDVTLDERIPQEAYRPTFVRSLAMMPIRRGAPIGALGAYWARHHEPTPHELMLLESLANASSIAVRNAELLHEARAATKARDEFLGSAAHELRTPLASAMLHVEAADRELRAGKIEAAAARLARVRTAGRRLSDLVDRLLRFAVRQEGRKPLSLEALEMRAVAAEVAERLGPLAEKNGCTLSLRVEGDSRGRWDRDDTDAIIANLVGNAVRYAPGSPIEIHVDGSARDTVTVTVTDDGDGIAPDVRNRIFEPYARGVSAIHEPGFGLGLAIVRDAAEAHGGAVSVDSDCGAGARFRVELPRSARVDD